MQHAITIHLAPAQQQQILIIAGFATLLILIAVTVIVNCAVKISELERDNADLQQRLVSAERIGQTQAVALQTVDALARATKVPRP